MFVPPKKRTHLGPSFLPREEHFNPEQFGSQNKKTAFSAMGFLQDRKEEQRKMQQQSSSLASTSRGRHRSALCFPRNQKIGARFCEPNWKEMRASNIFDDVTSINTKGARSEPEPPLPHQESRRDRNGVGGKKTKQSQIPLWHYQSQLAPPRLLKSDAPSCLPPPLNRTRGKEFDRRRRR